MKYLNINDKQSIKNYLAGHRIYIYGAGNEAHKIYNELTLLGINVDKFVVSDTRDNPKFINEIKVFDINTLEHEEDLIWVIGTSDKYKYEIEKNIELYGYKRIVKINENGNGVEEIALPKLEITTTIGCKVGCKYCPQKDLITQYYSDNKARRAMMTLEDFKICLDNMPSDTTITFSGFAEPFLNPNCVEMIKMVAEHENQIELYTTFVGLSKKEFDEIKNIDFRIVVLHTPDENNYAKIEFTDDYKEIVNEALNIKKRDGTSFVYSANCQSNPSEEFTKLANGRIKVTSNLSDRGGLLEGEKLRKTDWKNGKISCARSTEFNSWVLLPDGTVTLCCMDFGLKHQLGNLIENNYEYIKNDTPYLDLIERTQKDEKFLLCRRCIAAQEI